MMKKLKNQDMRLYFHPAEIVREIANALDSKNIMVPEYKDSKSSASVVLDDSCKDLFITKNKLEQLIEFHISRTIDLFITNFQIATHLKFKVSQMFDDYLNVVAKYNIAERRREQIRPWLIENFFCVHLLRIINQLTESDSLFNQSDYFAMMTSDNTLVTAFEIVKNLTKEEFDWNGFYKELKFEEQNKITSWQRGDHKPSLDSLKAIFLDKEQSKTSEVATYLLVARALAYFRSKYSNKICLNTIVEKYAINRLSINIFIQEAEYLQKANIEYVLNLTQNNPHAPQLAANQMISALIGMSMTEVENDRRNIALALEMIEEAMNIALYRAGSVCEKVIEVGLVLASLDEKPCIPLITKLKSIQNLYGYRLPTIVSSDVRRKKDNQVEDWEIEMWRSNAHKIFSQYGIKLPNQHPQINTTNFILIGTPEPSENSDTTKRKSKIKQRDTESNNLVKQVMKKDFDAVNRLVKANANPNKLNDEKESALLIALQYMDLTEPQVPDDRFYNLLKDLKLRRSIVNQISLNQHQSLLSGAIHTGKLDVVKNIIGMGADINSKVDGYDVDALTVCLQIIHRINNPNILLSELDRFSSSAMDLIDQLNDSDFANFIRDTKGNFGTNRELIKESMKREKNHPFRDGYHQMLKKQLVYNHKQFKLDEMRNIVRLLLDNGANPNSKYDYADIRGNTPFLLACESDEAELVAYMLSATGNGSKRIKVDINAVYRDSSFNVGMPVGYEIICKYYKSFETLQVIKAHLS